MKNLCLQRITKDLKEITNSPLEGIGIASIDNDPKKYVVNMKIMSGVYEGYCIQLLLTFPDDYPIKPPKILIYPGQYFDNIYHHHIFRSDLKDEKDKHFNKFCFDLLENDFLSTSSEKTGWNPSYTISTLLLQVQAFLSKPDFPTGYIPPKEKIDELMKSMETYEKSFTIKNENNEDIIKIHTWKNPYPEMYIKNDKDILENQENKEFNDLKEIKEDLTCFISRLNYIDDKNILLGYPIKKIRENSLIPIPEILSYECFIQESSKYNNDNYHPNISGPFYPGIRVNNNNVDNDFMLIQSIIRYLDEPVVHFDNSNNYSNNGLYKSANNEFYDTWLPIYINEEHFKKNKTTILNYFSILKFGNSGIKQYDFHPQYIFEIMPKILTQMIKKMQKEKISSSFLKCFFQNILMFKRLEKKYNDIFIKYQKYFIEIKINKFLKENKLINIKDEILELLILFYFSDNNIDDNIKQQFRNYIDKLKNLIYLNLFDKENYINFIDENNFIEDLKRNDLFYKIVDIIFIDSDFLILYPKKSLLCLSEILRNKIIKQMSLNFRDLYIKLNEKIKQKIKRILLNEFNFSSYFDINRYNYCFSDYSQEIKESTFSSYSEFLDFFFIINSIREKVLDECFLNDLENNYGIYLNNEAFIAKLNKKKKKMKGIDEAIEYFFGDDHDINSIKNVLFLGMDYPISRRFGYYYGRYFKIFKYNDYFSTVKYPFIEIDKTENQKIFKISETIKEIMDKDENFSRMTIKKLLKIKPKKYIINDKNTKIIERERINIKKSYDKNYNKALQRYNFKGYR